MKRISLVTLMLLICLISKAQTSNPNYDSTLAKKLGGNQYGMKNYILVILKTGSVTIDNKATRDSLFAGHLQNIGRLATLNKLVVAGPFGKNDQEFRGIFILNVSKMDEANQLLESDPAIKAQLLKAELFPWYGSAALPQYLPDHDKIWKTQN